jgi:hypothetical protein
MAARGEEEDVVRCARGEEGEREKALNVPDARAWRLGASAGRLL